MSSTSRDIPQTPYSYDRSQDPVIDGIAKRVSSLRAGGRLSPKVLGNIRKFFRIKSIYHSNAIEGNLLTVGETRQVVEMGLTITGKPLRDQAEAKNLSAAIDYLEQLATDTNRPIAETDIRQLHYLVLKDIQDSNAGKYRSVPVEISGSAFKPPGPESIAGQMEAMGEWLSRASVPGDRFGNVDGFLLAAAAHTWFVYIHPFVDGNGRVARLLMNLILMRYGYPIAVITKDDRLRYYDALEISQSGDLSPFLSLLAESVNESLEEYEKAAAEQREQKEWAESVAAKFSAREQIRARNEYEVWKSAMDLLKGVFRQSADALSDAARLGRVYFRDFGVLEFEKYLSLRDGASAKRTWSFRVDFRTGDSTARYLFFFGSPSRELRDCEVSLHVAREEPVGSFSYERLAVLGAPNVPYPVELGYVPAAETFVARAHSGAVGKGTVEGIAKRFFEDVIAKHFSA